MKTLDFFNMAGLELSADQSLRLRCVENCDNVAEAKKAYEFILEGERRRGLNPDRVITEEAPAVEVPEQYQTRLANSFVNILLFVVDPSTGEHVPAEEWRKREDKTTAEWVGIRNENGILFCIRKKELNEGKDLKWDEAHKMMDTDAGENLGRRKWWCDVYDAIYTAGLNDLLVEIGGDRIRDKFYWTEDKDVDPSYANNAWVFSGSSAYLGYGYSRFSALGARVFRAF